MSTNAGAGARDCTSDTIRPDADPWGLNGSNGAHHETALRTKKGSRLPDGWTPKPETIERFRTREKVDALGSLERFTNHFSAATGRAGLKLDWEATFRNWVLEDIARGRGTPLKGKDPFEPPEWKPKPFVGVRITPEEKRAAWEAFKAEQSSKELVK